MHFSCVLLIITNTLCLGLTTNRSSEGLYVVQNPSSNELTCISEDDDAAIIWNDDLTNNEDFVSFEKFKPLKPTPKNSTDCAIWTSNQCSVLWEKKKRWLLTNSIANPMNSVIDYRWEGFEEFTSNRASEENDDENFPTLPDSFNDTIVFSVRGTRDIQINLLGKDNSTSPYFLTKIAVEGKDLAIVECARITNDSQQTENQSCKEAQNFTLETTVLDAYEWRTFRLQWDSNENSIKLFDNTAEEAFFQSYVEQWHSVTNISVKSVTQARIRFHIYDYFLATRGNSVLRTANFNHSDNNFCVNILVSLCPECRLNVSLMNGENESTLAYMSILGDDHFYSNGLRTWRSIKVNMTVQRGLPASVNLRITSILRTQNFTNIWWAVDSLHFCGKTDGIRESTVKLRVSNMTRDVMRNIKCQKLLRSKIVIANLSTSKPLDNVIQLRKHIQKGMMPCSPEYRDYNGINCISSDCTCYQGFGKINGKACFSVVPGQKNITLVLGLNSTTCSINGSTLEVFEEPEQKRLKKETFSILPYTYHGPLKSYTEYNVRVELSNGSTFFINEIKTRESAPGKITNLNFTSKSADNITGEWKPPTQINGLIRNYTVTLQRINLIGCEKYNITSREESGRQKIVNDTLTYFDGLDPYAKYNFTVVANTVEPGPPLSETVETLQLNVSTTKVSNLRLIDGQSQLAWDKPENCMLITGPINFVKFHFFGISEWAKEFTFMDQTNYDTYDLKKAMLLPYTKYKVSAYIMRKYNGSVNPDLFQELSWMTPPAAPPCVKNIVLYEVDVENYTASIRWEPPYPANGVIESYEVSMTNGTSNGTVVNGYWSIKASDEKLNCTLSQNYVCLQNVSLPSNISIDSEFRLQVFVKNINVTTSGNKTSVMIKLDDFCEKLPDQPESVEVSQHDHGIVTLKWMYPLFTLTKIVHYQIEVEFLHTNLLMDPPMENQTLIYTITKRELVHSKELYLLSATDYSIHMVAVNYCNKTSTVMTRKILTRAAPDFANGTKLDVESNRTAIKLIVPAVVNATKNTTAVVRVKGILKCEEKSSANLSCSINKTESTNGWVAAEYLVNSSEPVPLTFQINQTYGVKKNYEFQPDETYEFKVTVMDWYSMTPNSLKSNPITFKKPNIPRKSNEIWLLGTLIPLICVFLLFIYYRKCRTVRTEPNDTFEMSIIRTMSASKDWVASCTIQQTIPRVLTRKARVSSLGKVQPHFYPVNIKEFEEYVNEALASRTLEAQYEMLPQGIAKSCEYGYLPENRFKNQFVDILPYDDNRIILRRNPNDSHSDYINASYIQGRRKAKAYIATQGPKRDKATKTNTVPDFWRMVWQENVRVICMLTNVIEDGKRKCEQYWPEIGKTIKFGNATVLNTEHQVFTDYTIRTLQLICLEGKREIKHFHYTEWPENGIPMYTQSLVTFLKKLLVTPPGTGPIVVHSCAGIGRTGTFIVCDISLRQAIKERTINIPTVTQKIRRYRTRMVNNAQQYVLAHLIMAECLIVQRTQIPCTDQLREKIEELRKQLPSDIRRLRRMVWQDKKLHSMVTRSSIGDYAIPNTFWEPDNEDHSPVVFSSSPMPDSWNGRFRVVSVEGVQRIEQYLATRSPSPSTLTNFWKLVAEKQIELIVVLQRPNAESTIYCDIIHDNQCTLHFHHTQVEAKSTLGDGQYFTQEKLSLTVASQDEMRVQPVTVLTCTGWAYEENETPPAVTGLVLLWMASEKVQRKESPTLVVCRDGITGSGLYIALSFLLDRMSLERKCDVISAVRTIQRSEPKFVQSLKQFEYLYDAAINYNSYFDTYANFS